MCEETWEIYSTRTSCIAKKYTCSKPVIYDHPLMQVVLSHTFLLACPLMVFFYSSRFIVIKRMPFLSENIEPHINTTLAQLAGWTTTKVLTRTSHFKFTKKVVRRLHKPTTQYRVQTHRGCCGRIIQVNDTVHRISGSCWSHLEGDGSTQGFFCTNSSVHGI